MQQKILSIRPFIGSKNFNESRNFYLDLGFEEQILNAGLFVFHLGGISFYLQDYYAKEWIENTMIFVEVQDVEKFWLELISKDLDRYKTVKLVLYVKRPGEKNVLCMILPVYSGISGNSIKISFQHKYSNLFLF